MDFMTPELQNLIVAYQRAVASAVKLLQDAGVALPASAQEWSTSGPRNGRLGLDARFQKHGFGCKVHVGDAVTDFDFGPNGEIDAFDAWRLFRFAGDHGWVLPYSTHRELDVLLLELEKDGKLRRLQGSALYRLHP
jgi:hypothetical protein